MGLLETLHAAHKVRMARIYPYKIPDGLRRLAALKAQARASAADQARLPQPDADPLFSEEAIASLRSPARQIVREVAIKHAVSVADLCSARRVLRLVTARHEACYRLRHETQQSLSQIGSALGGRDHTTVLHGVIKHARTHGLPICPKPAKPIQAPRPRVNLRDAIRAKIVSDVLAAWAKRKRDTFQIAVDLGVAEHVVAAVIHAERECLHAEATREHGYVSPETMQFAREVCR